MSLPIQIETPVGGWFAEKQYAARCTFRDLIGVEAEVMPGMAAEWIVRCGERHFSLPNLFFPEHTPNDYLTAKTLPSLPLESIALQQLGMPAATIAGGSLPALWGRAPLLSANDVDLLGGIFFLLTRYEELVIKTRDAHDRFPAAASLAVRAGYLHRPLADEYAEVLWQLLLGLAPGLTRGARAFRFSPTHDVDVPTDLIRHSLPAVGRRLAADILKRRSLATARETLTRSRDWRRDPVFCFDWMMNVSERHGFHSSFNFLAGATDRRDPGYDVTHPQLRRLMHDITARGHRIGLHGSYGSFADAAIIVRERKRLEAAAGVKVTTGRQHYLHFRAPDTWAAWNHAGMLEDSSVGFADHAGFRCGSSHSFNVFDLESARELALREHPLIAMEVSLLDPEYQGLSPEDAYGEAASLIDAARQFSGEFVFLWHNDNLVSDMHRDLYVRLLNYAANHHA
jgi:hypothetical protein